MYLDSKIPSYTRIKYGTIGTNGQLGYDSHIVSVQGKHYEHAISPHPPSCLIFDIDYQSLFTCEVALNDTSHIDSIATFYVYVDEVLEAVVPMVKPFQAPRKVEVYIHGAEKIRLEIITNKCEFCHALWLDPQISGASPETVLGPIGGMKIFVPRNKHENQYGLCVISVLTPEYTEALDDMLGSLYTNGNLNDAHIALFISRSDDKCIAVAKKYNAEIINCQEIDSHGFFIKSAIYAAARAINAEKYILLDGDMIIREDLNSIVNTLDGLARHKILVCREQGLHANMRLGDTLSSDNFPYFGTPDDKHLLRISTSEFESTMLINGGILAGTREAMLGLDSMLRSMMPQSSIWEKNNMSIKWREQGILNLALTRLDAIAELDSRFNIQLFRSNIKSSDGAAIWHFNGEMGKDQYSSVKGKYSIDSIQCNNIDNTESYNNMCKIYTQRHPENSKFIKEYDRDILSWLSEYIKSKNDSKILEVNGKYGLIASYMLSFISDSKWKLKTLMGKNYEYFQICNVLHWKDRSSKIELIYKDPILSLMNMTNDNDRFDIIITDTTGSEEMIFTSFLLSVPLIKEDGIILVIASKYSDICISSLKDRIQNKGYEVTNVFNGFFVKPNKKAITC